MTTASAKWFATWNTQWSAYVAVGLETRRYNDLASIPAVQMPSEELSREIVQLTNQLVSQFARPVVQVIARYARRQTRYGMEDTLRALEKHMLPLAEQSDATTIQKARELLEPLRTKAGKLEGELSGLPSDAGEVDRLVLATARWFKHEYFRWVDPMKCPLCGEDTDATPVQPTAEEREGGAGRCELRTCKKRCGGSDRFPRFNNVKALMESRRGRCGEFAQLFYFFLLVLGIEARYVWNSEDHVWTEYWSPALQHWVHVDSCEAEVNKPLLYARGWGKQQAYVLAFGRYGAEDVTPAYTDDAGTNMLFRMQKTYQDQSGLEEPRLRTLLLRCTVKCRALLDEEERLVALSMDEAQGRWMADRKGRWEEATRVNLHGRDSGTQEWKEARGETGEETAEAGDQEIVAAMSDL